MAGRPLRRARMNGAVNEQQGIQLTAHQFTNLIRLIEEIKSDLQYVNMSATQRQLIKSWFDNIVYALKAPELLD